MSLMLMMVVMVSLISLCSWWYCWQEVMKGNPHILSLRQVTLIMDRHTLDELYGKHEAGYRYKLNEAALKQIRSRYGPNVLLEMIADLVCFIGAYRHMAGGADPELLPLFVALGTAYQGFSLWYSYHLVHKYWIQIAEEMDD